MSAPFLTPAVAKLLAAVNGAPPAGTSPAEQRAALDGAMAGLGFPAGAPADAEVALASGAKAHLFRPDASGGAAPWIAYCHGGSFVAGGVPAHVPFARALAGASGCAVALIDYRLAPEHPAPAALDDCVDAVRRLAGGAVAGLSDRFALVGDSAGGALAAGAALSLADAGGPRAAVLALVNPMTSPTARGGSLDEYATGYFAGAADFALGWQIYGAGGRSDPLAEADLSRLPPTLVFTNEADPVRDQGEALAECASTAGVPVALFRMRGLVHAAWLFGRALPEAALVLETVGGAVGVRLRRPA